MAGLWSAAMCTFNNRLKLSGNAHHRGWADIDRRRKSDWPQTDPKNLARKLQDELSSDYKQYSPTLQESHDQRIAGNDLCHNAREGIH